MEEATDVYTQFYTACHAQRGMYAFSLQITRIYAIANDLQRHAFEQVQRELVSNSPNIVRLYHGTSAVNAREIIRNGFELPSSAGMFGKGIYFSDVPLKCWQYSTQQFLLVCDVALGNQRRMTSASHSLEGNLGAWDSIVGLTFQEGG